MLSLLLAAQLAAASLPPCPRKPNCVSSQEGEASRRIEPLRYSGGPAEAWARLKAVLLAMSRIEIVEEAPGRLRAVATTKLWRFKDDLEFLDGGPGVIEVRSASRIGYSDLGANRRRIERVRKAFATGT